MTKMNFIFLHGFLGSSMNWMPVIQRLRKAPAFADVAFVNPDLLGHGRKAEQASAHVDDLVEDLKQELPLQEGPFVALGHSFGLRPLLKLSKSSDFQKNCKLLIAEDSSPVISESGFSELKEIFEKVPVPFSSREEAKQGLESLFGKDSRMSRFLMTNIRELSPGQHSWRFDAGKLYALLKEAYENPLWEEWSQYPGQVLMLLGGRSSFVSDKRVEECLQRREQFGHPTHVQRIANAGHWVHADEAEAFSEALIQIVQNLR